MMLIRYFGLLSMAATLMSCTNELSEEQKINYIKDAEQRVVLPKGAGDLRCYERNYALRYEPNRVTGDPILVGVYHRAFYPETIRRPSAPPDAIFSDREPKVHWKNSDLKAEFVDAGCDTLFFQYNTDQPPDSVLALCTPTLDATEPVEVIPPVTC